MKNYWIFQYTTNIYKNVVDDFKNEKIKIWEVTKHKKKIKKGDIAIIYIGGEKAKAIYGVVELTSDIYHICQKNRDFIDINILENWSDRPISFHKIKKLAPDIIVGISGTNFKSSEQQLKKLKELL